MRIGEPLQRIHARSLRHLSGQLQGLVEGRLWLKVLLGLLFGIAAGILLGPSVALVDRETASALTDWLALPGQVFLGFVQMVVVPLVFASIIRGLAAADSREQLKKLGLSAGAFFVGATTLATVCGIALASWVRPGRFLERDLTRTVLLPPGTEAVLEQVPRRSMPEAIVGLIPTNPLSSMAQSDMLAVVIFAIVLGIAVVSLEPSEAKPVLSLLGSLQQICVSVVRWAMRLAPLAIFGLMTRITSKLGVHALLGLLAYVLTVLVGLSLVLLLFVLVAWGAGTTPGRFLRATREVQLLAFSTSSSAAVMPLTMKVAEDGLGVRSSISQLVVPLGATVNMAGTALYHGVATVFLAQVFGVELSLDATVLVVVTAVAASIGSPATPGVGIVVLSTVLRSAGIPVAGIALLMGVDRILDMARTAVNVTGDLCAAALLDHVLKGGKSAAQERAEEQTRESSGQDVVVAS